jgi:hypothetical protein
MARVSIKFFDDHETLENMLRYLCEKFGNGLRKIIFKDDSAVTENLIVFVNDENIVAKEGLKTKVNDRDQLLRAFWIFYCN